jgi:S-(hydroxymethyl)glutathione dehydrogenase/alcohol dehydrogenase
MMPDGTPRFRCGGQHIHQFSYVASHAEYTMVTEAGAIPIPKDMPFDRACLIGCGVMTGVGGALRIARVAAGSSTVTFGCGTVGLNAIQGARLAHSQINIAVDVNANRLRLAQELGATHIIDARQEDPVAAVLRLTHGRGADFGFEAAGNEAAMQNTISAVRRGGTVVILGKIPFDQYFRVQFGTFFGEKVLTRSSYGGARPMRDFPMLAQAYLDGQLKLDELITSRVKLPDINTAFDGMTRGEVVRSVVVFD